MDIKRLVIKNFGDIEYLDYEPLELANCVTPTVANAISHVLNNRFAIMHYNTVELRRDTYLFGEIHRFLKGKRVVYTVEINGFESPVFTKNGVKMTEDEIDGDGCLTRPYREDNGCIFSVENKNSFLDYGEFLPLYFSRLTEYSPAFKDVLENKRFCCDEDNLAVMFKKGKPIAYWRPSKNHSFKVDSALSECDRHSVNYTVFLRLLEMVNFHRQFKNDEGIMSTPIIVDGLLSHLDIDPKNTRFLLERTKEMARQTFFVERKPEYFKHLMKY